MLTSATSHLSLWEIAHRWHHHDPMHDGRPPVEVRDLLREITTMQSHHRLAICNQRGIVLKNLLTAPRREDFWVERHMVSTLDEFGNAQETEDELDAKIAALSYDEVTELWSEFVDNWCERHDREVSKLSDTITGTAYPRDALEAAHLQRSQVERFCAETDRELPEFWFSEAERQAFQILRSAESPGEQPEAISAPIPDLEGRLTSERIDQFWDKLAHKQRHRLLCRHFAEKIWQDKPETTIAAICRHEIVREWAGAKYYGDKDTIRNWIKDLDPRPSDQRNGRPTTT